MLVIRLCVFFDLLWRERRTGIVTARRVANQTGEVADQENDLVTQILQLAHFVKHDGVTDMDVRRSRVEPQFDPQGLTRRLGFGEFFHPRVLGNELLATAQSDGQSMLHRIAHGCDAGGICCRYLIHKGLLPKRVYWWAGI